MTRLRQMMLHELQRRNYAATTVQNYVHAVEEFAKHFHLPPDQLNQEHLREYQAYLLRDRKLEPRTAKLHVSAPLFLRQDAETPLSAGRHSGSESPAPTAPHPSG